MSARSRWRSRMQSSKVDPERNRSSELVERRRSKRKDTIHDGTAADVEKTRKGKTTAGEA
ncbi:hypothetical protein SCLCIDRAFT_1217711 [Scleroderma citrinum Foug A]|uniref:Uncharacterized protein n=1 Tax=Scleroderma citrinum Foug A TaxID=1036808 RepID=A0A0C3DF72_9AGAM|nr:hypothetical protein SCLCIDRAFT_1217711 [Scleroderma citrinum Foug A]